jgi:hypothetical protein|nr:MAG TPA: hypothetical protein [Caudoviricetes sp.]
MWKIKDPEAVKAMIIRLLSDDEIAKRCNRQMDDGSSFILLSDDNDNIMLRLEKERFVNVPEYKPNDWNPFPEVKPPKVGQYLVTRLMKTDSGDTRRFVQIAAYEYGHFYMKNDVIAFRELPVPYYERNPWEDDDNEPEEGD